jgi:hypothetical protein
MYENRETSELSARGSGADRPEKADCRKTGANGTEESDCAVVPMKELNKGEPLKEGLNAEAGEGRAWTEESISQAHPNPTQGGKKCVSQGVLVPIGSPADLFGNPDYRLNLVDAAQVRRAIPDRVREGR